MCQVNSSPAREDVDHNNDGYQYVPVGYKDDGCQHAPHINSTPARKENTKVRRAPPCGRREAIVVSVFTLAPALLVLVLFFVYVVPVLQPPPNLHIRLVRVDGLDPHTSPPEPLVFHLALDADEASPGQGYQACGGGEYSMLRVSYHGMILAWGRVPWFCIHGGRSIATVVATAEGAVVREEVRGLVLSEQHVLGKAEFDVEGEVAKVGYLGCKILLFES